jgi:predicted metal-dependent peptidase
MDSELIASALLSARLIRPYYARAIAALTPIAKPGLGTIAVDARWHLYYDPEWLAGLDPAHRGAVIAAHEVEHLLRDHFERAKAISADARAWNCCGDAEINDDALDGELPPDCVHPKKLGWQEGLTAEDYYSEHTVAMPSAGVCAGGSGAGCPHDWEISDGGVEPGNAETLRDAVAQDVRAHVAQHGRGSVPAGVQVWADARAVPVVIPWRTLLRRAVLGATATLRGRQVWSARPARRQRDNQPIRPSTARTVPHIGVVVDTSGSMGSEGDVVMGALATMRSITTRMTVVACDAAVTGRSTRMPRTWRGGGGTDLRQGISQVGKCDMLVVITDGDTPWPEVTPSNMIVLCTTDRSLPDGCQAIRLQDVC